MLEIVVDKVYRMSGFTSFCYDDGEVLITLNGIYFGLDLCDLFFIYLIFSKCVWKYLKVGRAVLV